MLNWRLALADKLERLLHIKTDIEVMLADGQDFYPASRFETWLTYRTRCFLATMIANLRSTRKHRLKALHSDAPISVREWQWLYRHGAFRIGNYRKQTRAGWYFWSCPEAELPKRLKALAPVIMRITDPYVLDHYFLWLKNNRPVSGPLYDDISFEPMDGKRDGKHFLISHCNPFESKSWTLTAERSGYDKPEYECSRIRTMAKYINRLGHELELEEARKGSSFRGPYRLFAAYGPYLNQAEMRKICHTAEPLDIAYMKGLTLAFRGETTGNANMILRHGARLPVLVWRIYRNDERRLDVELGVPYHYRKETLFIDLNGYSTEVMFYVLAGCKPPCSPSERLVSVIAEGYKQLHLDTSCLENALQECSFIRKEKHDEP